MNLQDNLTFGITGLTLTVLNAFMYGLMNNLIYSILLLFCSIFIMIGISLTIKFRQTSFEGWTKHRKKTERSYDD